MRKLLLLPLLLEVALARTGGLSCAQLCVGTLLRTPGLTGCIVGARNARQGSLIANLGVTVSDDQADAAWEIVRRLQQDLELVAAGLQPGGPP